MNAEASANAWVFSFLQILTLHYRLKDLLREFCVYLGIVPDAAKIAEFAERTETRPVDEEQEPYRPPGAP